MDKRVIKLEKQFHKGVRHGKLNVYNPGVLFPADREAYTVGYRHGRSIRFRAIARLS